MEKRLATNNIAAALDEPRLKHQTPTSKLQRSSKSQAPSAATDRCRYRGSPFEFWCLNILELGALVLG
jgi:hypothetical protein